MPPRRQSSLTDLGESLTEPSPSSSSRRRGKDKESFGCPFPGCGQTYSRMEYLKRHQRKHQDDRPFQCKDCSKAFARSDVLLRHRRRCHPTPPPADRSSHSPLPTHRSYPGVPVSSSRNDYRELSPDPIQPRKHSRQDSDDRPRQSRPRLRDEDEFEEDERFGESSQYGRHNGMGNGGVFGGNNFYEAENDPSYTPHLLPMFQHAPAAQYQPPNESNHLEDASVLLSMAYPSGVPSNAPSEPAQGDGQHVMSDWETGQQTINAMMEAANADGGSLATVTSKIVEEQQTNIDPVFTDPMNNFLGPMDWLTASGGPGKEVQESLGAWMNSSNPSPRATSPYPISSLFSPSAFGITNPSTASNQSAMDDETKDANAAVMSILDQLAMMDTPQTKANPNPERPLLRLAHRDMLASVGDEISKDNRFYIPADRFEGCYSIPHWSLPPLKTLSLMANRTFDTVLKHFSFVHMPTFKLVDTAACLAFAICTIGGIKNGSKGDAASAHHRMLLQHLLDGPVPPGQSWESMYKANYLDRDGGTNDADMAKVEQWDNALVVRSEKSNMLVKSFSLAQGVLMTEYNVGLLQALLLYHAPYFLSVDERERQMSTMFLGTIVHVTRQIGFFNKDLEHNCREYQLPPQPSTPGEIDLHWRQWIQLETRRRTAFLVYHLDTVSALESNISCIISPCEMAEMPLPAPDSLWQAPTAEAWLKAARDFRPMTLDEAMRRIFYLPTYGAFDALHEKADTKFYNLLNESELGPFARSAMVLTLLRGVIDIGEGKRDRGDWRDLTDLWMGCTWLKPGKKMLDSQGNDLGPVCSESLRQRFQSGLQRWREGWDFDPTCSAHHPTSPTSVSPSSDHNRSSKSPESSSRLNYCEEALPFYWLAQALMGLLNAAPPNEPGWNSFSHIKYGEMLKSARTFTRMGEGVQSQTQTRSSGTTTTTPLTSVSSSGMSATTSGHRPATGTGSSIGVGVGAGLGVGNGNGNGAGSYAVNNAGSLGLDMNMGMGADVGMSMNGGGMGGDDMAFALGMGMGVGDDLLADLGTLEGLGELGF